MKGHTVAIVLDVHASGLLLNLAGRCHIWLVESVENNEAAQALWGRRQALGPDLTTSVTTFIRHSESPEEALESVLELVEDHHGEYANEPPLNEVLIFGVDPSSEVLEVLQQWGFSEIRLDDGEIVATR